MSKFYTRKGQTIIEYVVVITCIVAAFIAAQHYLRRALQGRLRSAADQIGEQYAPTNATGGITTTLDQDILTEIRTDEPVTVGGKSGYATYRKEDITKYDVTRSGTETMGAFK